MKKFLLTILPLVAVLFLGACSDGDGDGDGAKQYSLTVNVTLPETIDWADVTSESVIARNQLTGAEFTASKMGEGVYTITVEPGKYNVNALFETADVKLNAQRMGVSVYESVAVSLVAEESLTSALVIKEFYTAMGKSSINNKQYMMDQFYEIYNNSAFTVYLDNCLLANTEVAANTKNVFWGDNDEVNKEVAVKSYVAAWVGDGTGKKYPLAPGESVVVAWQAQNHMTIQDDPETEEIEINTNTVDLSNADYEIDITDYQEEYVANPDVPNLTIVAKPGTQTLKFGLIPAFGAGLILAQVDDVEAYVANEENWKTKPEGTDQEPYLMIKYKDIQDAINIVNNAETNRRVVLPATVDAGMIWTSANYNGMGFTRKVAETVDGRVVYKDTNNSSEDFEAEAKPTPGI
ncbi:MAG: DUF4876 domain-containing protein [Bacteroidales bacterium]|nr:DUF4876 domain-containing protein [Bacteroidales bacterium]